MTALSGWENFYVIVGSSAGALIGLQFVVITLIADMPIPQVDQRAIDAFTTPTIVHFGVVLLLAAILSAPWTANTPAVIALGLAGLGGVIYMLVVIRHLRVQSAYEPEFQDWVFYVLVPFAAYVVLAVLGYAARTHMREALFGVAGAALALLFIGIRNAWDTVTYAVLKRRHAQQEREQGE